MAVRLADVFGEHAETWERMQRDYDLAQVRVSPTRTSRWLWVRSADLESWSATTDARYSLPQLVRRLVLATNGTTSRVDFPTGEDAQKGEWDGLVESKEEDAHVPLGLSVWELSSEGRPNQKAQEDHKKRTANPLGLDPRQVTYVAVTSRHWGKKRDWEAAKNSEGRWRRVVAYDASDLEQWIEQAPAVGVWFATLVGKRPAGVESLEEYWRNFSLGTSPPMDAELVLAGRGEQAKAVRDWLEQGQGVFRLLADSSQEAIAFLAASVLHLPEDTQLKALSRTVIVTDAEQVRHLSGIPRSVAVRMEIKRFLFAWYRDH